MSGSYRSVIVFDLGSVMAAVWLLVHIMIV